MNSTSPDRTEDSSYSDSLYNGSDRYQQQQQTTQGMNPRFFLNFSAEKVKFSNSKGPQNLSSNFKPPTHCVGGDIDKVVPSSPINYRIGSIWLTASAISLLPSRNQLNFLVLPSLSRAPSETPHYTPVGRLPDKPEYETLTPVGQTGPIYNAIQQEFVSSNQNQAPSYSVSTIISSRNAQAPAANYTKI